MNFKSNKGKCAFFNLRKYFSLILVLCLWAISPQLQGQSNSSGNTKIVKGVVLDELSEPMIGVNVMEKGTSNGTITDFNGKFQLKVASGAKLVITYIGYAAKEVVVGAGDMKIQMATDAKMIDEVIVIGYGTQKKATMVGAVTQATSDDLRKQGTVVNLTQALTGSMPGVTVLNTSGIPGNDAGDGYSKPAEILIRGKNTWNSNSPLILVDGIERSMYDIDINEVETVSTLKDASATAVFGMKGANGVILITTKRGLVGKPKLSFEANRSFESISKYPDMVDSYNALKARNYAIINEVDLIPLSWAYYQNDKVLNHYKNQDLPFAYPDNNWQEVMTKDFSTSSRVNMNISGGTNFVKYFGSLSYLNEGDILNTQDLGRGYNPEFSYDRFNIRTNLDFSISKTTTLKTSISGVYGTQQQSNGGVSGIYTSIYGHPPNTPVIRYEDGVFGYSKPAEINNDNIVDEINSSGTRVTNRLEINTDFTLNQKLDFITKGLSFNGKLAYDNFFGTSGPRVTDGGVNSKYIKPEFYLQGGSYNYETQQYEMNGVAVDMVKDGWAQYANTSSGSSGFGWVPSEITYSTEGIDDDAVKASKYSLYYSVSLNYARDFGKHGITALALFSRRKAETGSGWPNKEEDYVGRVTYDYNRKYFAEANFAYNGSEAFGPGYKFDFFPSVAIGWNIANEPFIRENVTFLEILKVKYSNGLVGNSNVGAGRWPYLTIWSQGNPLANDQNRGFGVTPVTSYQKYQEGNPGNPDLRWEKANKQNLGTEFGLFKGLISGSIDLFSEHRYDMLVAANSRRVPHIFGQTPPAANIGEIKSKGMEIEVSVSKSYKSGFSYKVGGSWTYARNTVIKKEDAELKPFYQKDAGYPIGQNRLTQETGLMTSWDDVYNGVIGQGSNVNRLPGDFVFMDYNANGRVDPDDAAPYGYPVYPFSTYTANISLGYKGWDFSALFYGTHNVNREVGFGTYLFNGAAITQLYLDKTATPELGNVDPTFPHLNFQRGAGAGTFNTFDGALLRLKSIQISYSLPKRWIKTIGCSEVRFFANGNNLFLWTDMPADGEGRNKSDDNGRNYPLKKSATIGTTIKF